ncbi:MAG TPA: hypothetical protein EYN00_01090 [Planctomycetes bacterium]|nr:hypothetical protein [Planctomycetota bacterium]
MSRVDKTITRCLIDVDIDLETNLPRGIKMTVLTGVRGGGKSSDGNAFGDNEHVAFHFDYKLDPKKTVARFDIPREAQKLMTK